MSEFFADPGSPFSDEDARELGPELVKLAERGASAPDEIVAYAKANDTPLETALHLDKPLEEVAEKWYRQRARQVASSIMVRVQTQDGGYRKVRAFHSVEVTTGRTENGDQPPERKRQYVTIDQVRDSEALSGQVLKDALNRLNAWRKRFEDYRDVLLRAHPELEDVFAVAEQVEEKVA